MKDREVVMTVAELLQRLGAVSNPNAEVLVRAPDPNNPDAPDDYTIEDLEFIDWPDHYKRGGDPLGVGKFSRPEVYLKV